MERRYDEAQAQLKFEAWRRVCAYSQDAMRELHDFHDAMHNRVTTLRCAESVMVSLGASDARAAKLAAAELAGLDLSMVWPVLWSIIRDVAVYVGGGAVLGGALGGVIGAFFGGAGAIPGAIGGAGVGAEIGGWLLGLLGIKCLLEYIGKAIPEMAGQYARGFAQAWRAGELPADRSQEVNQRLQGATEAFARGHVLLVIALLSAIVLYLSRGALGRSKLYGELARSKLGPKFAQWVEENEARLAKHPALQPEKAAGASMMEGPKTAESGPAQPSAPQSGRASAAAARQMARPATAADELRSLPQLRGMKQDDIAAILRTRGYAETPARSGGTVWTRDLPDGNTASVRLDPPNPQSPSDWADAVEHAHKEIVPTDKVVGGNYHPRYATTLDDGGNMTTSKSDTHIPTGREVSE